MFGRFIVIDGTDGTGKSTQISAVAGALKQQGLEVRTLHFPRYGAKSTGMVENYLSGKYGEAEDVNAYTASVFYACDRYDASAQIRSWLKNGYIVIADRYVTSNMAHQGGKIKDVPERNHYFEWLNNLEYRLMKIPRPDRIYILTCEPEIAQRLGRNSRKNEFIGQDKDIHLMNLDHIKSASEIYKQLAENNKNIELIECTKFGELLPIKTITDLLLLKINGLIGTIDKPGQFPTQRTVSAIENLPLNNIFSVRIIRSSPLAHLPKRPSALDPCYILYSGGYHSLEPGESALIATGLKLVLPDGLLAFITGLDLTKKEIRVSAIVYTNKAKNDLNIELTNISHDILHLSPETPIASLHFQRSENVLINYIDIA